MNKEKNEAESKEVIKPSTLDRTAEEKKRVGEELKQIRISREITHYRMTKDFNIRRDILVAIEKGETAYSIDSFLRYLEAIGAAIKIEPNK